MKDTDYNASLGHAPATAWHVNAQQVDMTRTPPPPRRVAIQAEPQHIVVDANKTAIVVIDMQNDFCHPDGWLAHIGVDVSGPRQAIEPLADLLPVLRTAEVPVVWVNWGNRLDRRNISAALLHVYNPDGQSVGLGDAVPASGAPVLERDSWGAATVDELVAAPGDIHVDKYRMSGFWDNELDSVLKNAGITTLLFAGVNSDQCVLHTLADANFLGYDCVLVDDCATTASPEFCREATRYNVKQIFGFVAHSADVRAGFAQSSGESQ
ncbi:isochorismatase protein [Salinisphaera shabanensis E1L3A]|uniref:Isochorismatase protein n=1 Tax=Salinisphaera shabanensis E1L3A TaxID=1033802 RepID=U2ENA9_9GAMM|nr:isochorismatase family cysteine hydrolase [Salinisphaera shabanensis]ERJ19617.1 isochorismatase protein [Salinisphaera shabanensis E1L3A]